MKQLFLKIGLFHGFSLDQYLGGFPGAAIVSSENTRRHVNTLCRSIGFRETAIAFNLDNLTSDLDSIENKSLISFHLAT